MSTSRIIVKCLPKKISEDKFRDHFAKCGVVTDARLKFTKDGKFRQFGFVGYKTEEEAQKAVDYFNNTFIDASRLVVEPCKPLNDASKSRPWSKYSKESSSFKKANGVKDEPKAKKKDAAALPKEKKASVVEKLLGDLKDDEQFKEFVAASKAISAKDGIWKNDAGFGASGTELIKAKKPEKKAVKAKEEVEFDDSDDSDSEVFDVTKAMAAKKKLTHSEGSEDDEDIEEDDQDEKVTTDGPEVKPEEVKKPAEKKKVDEEEEGDFENGRLFLRNLCYTCKEEDLEKHFAPYGPLVEVNIPIDNFSKKPKGFAYVTCMFPEKALKAFNQLDGTIFQGRMLHILPAKSKRESDESPTSAPPSFKAKKEQELKKKAQSSHNWNSLFISQDAVANLMASRYNVDKSELFDVHKAGKKAGSVAVKLAVGETQIVNDMKKFLVRNGVKLDAFSSETMQATTERSKTVILIKNLPNNTSERDLRELFDKCKVNGAIKRFVMPEYGVAALIEFGERQEARDAFKKLAYRKFKSVPIYLEWAPVDVFEGDPEERAKLEKEEAELNKATNKSVSPEQVEEEEEVEEDFEDAEPESTLFVKNLNFDTTEESLKKMFAKVARCKATIAKKLSPNKETLSMGYGFVQFKKAAHAREAIKTLQGHMLDGHNLELKPSNRSTSSVNTKAKNAGAVARAGKQAPKEKSTKILVRNIPFEAKAKEIEELFRVFGELKYVRLPKKIDGAHRGFGFVDFVSLNDAQRAFEALSHSTHFFGRRLVLEWAEPEQSQDVEILRAKEEQVSGPKAKKLKKAKILEDLGQNDELAGGGGSGGGGSMDVN